MDEAFSVLMAAGVLRSPQQFAPTVLSVPSSRDPNKRTPIASFIAGSAVLARARRHGLREGFARVGSLRRRHLRRRAGRRRGARGSSGTWVLRRLAAVVRLDAATQRTCRRARSTLTALALVPGEAAPQQPDVCGCCSTCRREPGRAICELLASVLHGR